MRLLSCFAQGGNSSVRVISFLPSSPSILQPCFYWERAEREGPGVIGGTFCLIDFTVALLPASAPSQGTVNSLNIQFAECHIKDPCCGSATQSRPDEGKEWEISRTSAAHSSTRWA